MSRFVKVLSVAVVSLGLAGGAEAASYSFSTADNPINAGFFNQGWWSSENTTDPGLPGSNNVYTGRVFPDQQRRGYFTFDLSGLNLAANEVIASVTFGGFSSSIAATNNGAEVIGLFDVSTSASVLNKVFGTTEGVFEDLGSGNIYGSHTFLQSDAYTDFLVDLNPLAYADILTAQGGYFSIGASLLSLGFDDQEFVFGDSGGNPFTLNIETRISAVPLPAALPLYGAGLAVMGFIGWRKRKNAAA